MDTEKQEALDHQKGAGDWDKRLEKQGFQGKGHGQEQDRLESWIDLLQQKQGPISASPKASFWNEAKYKSPEKAKERLIGKEYLWSRAKEYSWDCNTGCKMEGGALQARGGEDESPKTVDARTLISLDLILEEVRGQ